MRNVFKIVFIALAVLCDHYQGMAQTSSVGIYHSTAVPVMVNHEDSTVTFYFDFTATNINDIASIHILAGQEENSEAVQSNVFGLVKKQEGFYLSSGEKIENNRIRCKIQLTPQEFHYAHVCTIYIKDRSGLLSNKIYSRK